MKSKTILIAYQDDLLARSLCTFFCGMGYRIEMAQKLSEMDQKVGSGNIHVILLDDEIEGVKAYHVVPFLKRSNPRAQVVMISSEESLSSVRRLREAGIFYQAMKPVDLEEVHLAVECAFEKIGRENSKEGFFPRISQLVPA